MMDAAANRFNLRKNVWFAVVEFAVNLALVFITYRLVIVKGGIEAVGVWATLYAWASLVRMGDAGMAHATLRYVAVRDVRTDPQGIRTYAETGILTNAALFGMLCALGYCLMVPAVEALVGAGRAADARAALPWLMVGVFLFNLNSVVSGALMGLHQGYRRSQIAMAGSLVQLALAALLVPHLGLVGLAIAQIVQYGLSAAAAWQLFRVYSGIASLLPIRFSLRAFKEMLGYSLMAQAANISSGLFEPVSKMLVAQFGGMYAQGLYELAFKTVWLSRNAVVSGLTATLPAMTTLVAADAETARPAYERANVIGVAAAATVLGGIIVSAPFISRLWLGDESGAYVIYVTLLAFGALGSAFGANAYNLAFAVGALRNTILINGLMLVGLAIGGIIAGTVWGVGVVVLIVAVVLCAGGLAVRLCNDRMLPR